MQLDESELLQTLSIAGLEKDGTKVEFELLGDHTFSPTWDINEQTLTISHIKTDESEEKLKAPSLLIASRIIEPVIEEPKTSAEVDAPLPSPEEAKEDSTAEGSSTMALNKLQFLLEESSESLEIDLSAWPEYRLSQINDNQFLLTLGDCTIGEKSAALPIFAPKTSRYFTHAIASQNEESVRVDIHVEQNVKLSPRVVGTKLLIAANSTDEKSSDSMNKKDN